VFVYLFALVPRGLGIKIQAECRGQHGRGGIMASAARPKQSPQWIP
jgi:hypothetical protein